MKTKKILASLITVIFAAALFAGCTGPAAGAEGIMETGTIILKVNPEISIKYNKDGLVTGLEGVNDDGRAIVDGYGDYIGKDARQVVKELVEDISEAGYFVSGVDGKNRSVTIRIEPGSVLPRDDYMEVLADDVRDKVRSLELNSGIVGIDRDDDLDDDRYGDLDDDRDGDRDDDRDGEKVISKPAVSPPAKILAPSKAAQIKPAQAKPAPAQPKPAPSPAPVKPRRHDDDDRYDDDRYDDDRYDDDDDDDYDDDDDDWDDDYDDWDDDYDDWDDDDDDDYDDD